MKGLLSSFLDFPAAPGLFQQINPGPDKSSPVLLIFLLLILTIIIIWISFYYWKQERAKASREKFRINSAKMIKNGRKYTQAEKVSGSQIRAN
jgi:hypothetical protein